MTLFKLKSLPGRVLYTFFKDNKFEDKGSFFSADTIKLKDASPTLQRNMKPLVADSSKVTDLVILQKNYKPTILEPAKIKDLVTVQLVGKITILQSRSLQVGSMTLISGFGNGGFGQLCFGGSLTINA